MSKQLDIDKPVDMDDLLDTDELLDIDDLLDTDEPSDISLYVDMLLDTDEPLEKEDEYYFDRHPTEEELMPEASIHARLIRYLIAVLEQLFAGETYAIHQNLNFYQTPALYEHPLAPDIALIKGVCWEEIRSWKIDRTGPPPQLVIEIASEETWKNDRKKKSALYGPMGVLEYFVYDPNTPPCWKDTPRRLFGWRWDPTRHKMRKIRSNKQGWLWSQQLNSWLVPDDGYLRLYDRHHQLHLTGEEAQALRADAEAEARRVEAKRAEEEKRRADAEAEARQTEAKRAQALAEKLRALGINPDEIA